MFPGPRFFFRAAGFLFFLSALLAVYLSIAGFKAGHVAGCGGDSGCGSLLSGRWGKLYPGLPVGLPAFFAYAALCWLAFTRRQAPRLTWLLCGLVVGAAAWFVALQIRESAFCPYCTAAHFCAVLGVICLFTRLRGSGAARPTRRWLLPGLAGVLLAGAMALLQITMPVSATRAGNERHVIPALGKLEISELPGTGNLDGESTAILLFDYCCPHCRVLQADLLAMRKELAAAQVRVAFLPAPLNSDCNPALVSSPGPQFDHACDYALTMLGLWRRDAQRYAELLEHVLAAGPLLSIEEVELLADGKPEGENLIWAEKQIAEGTRLYAEVVRSTGIRALPILLHFEKSDAVRSMQGKMNVEELRDFLLQRSR